MALPWHKLNHKKQNNYIILVTILLAAGTVAVVYLMNIA